MLSKEEIENILKDISQGFRKIPQVENILYPLDINQFQKLSEYIEQLEEEKEKAYWQGYIQKQNEAIEICKQCKCIKKARQLETQNQDLIEKLEEDKKEFIKELNYGIAKREARLQLQLVDKYLKILKGGE